VRTITAWFFFILSLIVLGLWWIPKPNAPVRGTALVQEEERKNLYVFWDGWFYHFRSFPPRVNIVPHVFLVYLEWGIFEKFTDTFSISYRPFVKTKPANRLYWQFWSFRAYQGSFDPEEHWRAQAEYCFVFPIWFLYSLLIGYPILVFLRGPVRRRWRIRRGRCARCSYELRGNESGTCPECGTAVSRLRRDHRRIGHRLLAGSRSSALDLGSAVANEQHRRGAEHTQRQDDESPSRNGRNEPQRESGDPALGLSGGVEPISGNDRSIG
jgi:hypothetical protein